MSKTPKFRIREHHFSSVMGSEVVRRCRITVQRKYGPFWLDMENSNDQTLVFETVDGARKFIDAFIKHAGSSTTYIYV